MQIICGDCQNKVTLGWSGCPECLHREVGAKYAPGMAVTVSPDSVAGWAGERVTIVRLHRNTDQRLNGIADVRPERVITGHSCGAPVTRPGTDRDVRAFGVRALLLGCGKHATDYACDCDTIAAEADAQS